jgi:Tol biopolymer transport system component
MKRYMLACLALFLGAITIAAQAPAGFELTLVGVDGTKHVLGRLPPSTYAPRIAPDGKCIAFETRDPKSPEGAHIWVTDVSDVSARRALPGTGAPLDWAPTWSADGERLVFIMSSDRGDAIYWRRADGMGDAEYLSVTYEAPGQESP